MEKTEKIKHVGWIFECESCNKGFGILKTNQGDIEMSLEEYKNNLTELEPLIKERLGNDILILTMTFDSPSKCLNCRNK